MSETKTFEELFLSECAKENLSVKDLKILLITDLHKNYGFLEKLKEWHTKNIKKFNYILVTGDILTLKYPENDETESIAKSEADISAIISFLENMCLNVIYIGGNHDPRSLFTDNNQQFLTIKSVNLHKKALKVANDLYFYGLGGAVPTITSKNNMNSDNFQPYVDIDLNSITNVYWEGYPYQNSYQNPNFYTSDEIYEKDLFESFEQSFEKIQKENSTPNKKFILLTHNGPFFCQSSVMEHKEKCVYMGSLGLSKFLKRKNEDILLNIHGHTHSSQGLYSVGNVKVINPGALTIGKFSLIELKRDCNDDWYLYSTEFLDLSL